MTALEAGLTLSVVIPLFNEEESLPHLAEELVPVLEKLGIPYEVIVVNDGSTDRTAELLDEIIRSRAMFRALHFERNSGVSSAMAAGFRSAYGSVVVTMDADLQNDPADIPSLLEKIKDYDCVCSVRTRRRDSWLRRISSRIGNGVRNRLSRESVTDTACALKAFRAEWLQRIYLFRGAHRFLPTLLKMEGARVTEVPVNHRPRTMGESKFGVWNRVFCAFHDLLGVRWMQDRRLVYRIVRESGQSAMLHHHESGRAVNPPVKIRELLTMGKGRNED